METNETQFCKRPFLEPSDLDDAYTSNIFTNSEAKDRDNQKLQRKTNSIKEIETLSYPF